MNFVYCKSLYAITWIGSISRFLESNGWSVFLVKFRTLFYYLSWIISHDSYLLYSSYNIDHIYSFACNYMTGIRLFDFETSLEWVLLRVFYAFNDFSLDQSQVAELRFCHKNFFNWPRQKMTCWLFKVDKQNIWSFWSVTLHDVKCDSFCFVVDVNIGLCGPRWTVHRKLWSVTMWYIVSFPWICDL